MSNGGYQPNMGEIDKDNPPQGNKQEWGLYICPAVKSRDEECEGCPHSVPHQHNEKCKSIFEFGGICSDCREIKDEGGKACI